MQSCHTTDNRQISSDISGIAVRYYTARLIILHASSIASLLFSIHLITPARVMVIDH